jgi:hypothetical protein
MKPPPQFQRLVGGKDLAVSRLVECRDRVLGCQGGPAAAALGRRGLYYATTVERVPVRRRELTIQYLDFATGRTTPLFRREGAFHQGLAVSPDENWILFGEAPAWQADLVLMENFR